MGMPMVRRAALHDLEEWMRMRALLWPECPIEDHRVETERMLEDGLEEIAFVADKSNGGLAGFVEARLRPYADGCATSPVGYVEGWYVDADMRQRGIGAQLIAAAEAWAIFRGCREMASDAELHNDVSQAAHARLGYDEVERVVRYRKRLAAN